VISLAVEKARKGVLSWKEDVDAIANRQNDATQARSEALDGLRMLAYWDLTNEVIKFDPHFPIVGNFTVPSPHETHLLNMLDGLERVFITNPKESGH
jgi:hypothetical protein